MAQARSEVPMEETWNLELMYTDDAWDKEFASSKTLADQLTPFKGRIGESETTLRDALIAYNSLNRILEKLGTFAGHKGDEDLSNSKNSDRLGKITTLGAQINSDTAWFIPELLAIPNEKIEKFSTTLSKFLQRQVQLLVRKKPHVLSAAEEAVVALAEDPLSVSYDAFSKLTNADFCFGKIEADGKLVPLTNGSYIQFLRHPDRQVRHDAFKKVWKRYNEHVNVLSVLLNAQIFDAKIHHYESTIKASLFNDNIDVKVYDSLIQSIHTALPIFYDYVSLRRDVLRNRGQLKEIKQNEKKESQSDDKNDKTEKSVEKKDQVDMFDMYLPLVADADHKIEFSTAKEWILEALGVLGKEYVTNVERAFNERWIDVRETKNKRSGAYSGGCIDSNPYILLNYNDNLDSVFTLAHELGHSLHSLFSNTANEFPINSYRIFVAEIASTVNECLLWFFLKKKFSGDRKMSTDLFNVKCDDFKATVFRQTMFGEFEQRIHALAEKGETLTPEVLKKEYYELNAKYYGPLVVADNDISLEWAKIPHFYYNFYVYKYATSFCGAEFIASRIIDETTRADMVSKYLGFLKSGQQSDPLALLAALGVDMTTPVFVDEAMKTFAESVKNLRTLLEEK